MNLREKQSKFMFMVARLILHAQQLGFEVTGGDLYRDPRATYGHPKSTHRSRLAIDLNLFIDGEYIQDGRGHDKLHDYWDSIGGAKRIEKDMNHYSLKHNGVR